MWFTGFVFEVCGLSLNLAKCCSGYVGLHV